MKLLLTLASVCLLWVTPLYADTLYYSSMLGAHSSAISMKDGPLLRLSLEGFQLENKLPYGLRIDLSGMSNAQNGLAAPVLQIAAFTKTFVNANGGLSPYVSVGPGLQIYQNTASAFGLSFEAAAGLRWLLAPDLFYNVEFAALTYPDPTAGARPWLVNSKLLCGITFAPTLPAPISVASVINPDRDDDGFLNEKDKCPDEAEVFNGYNDHDGCPDVKPENSVKYYDAIDLIFFALNSSYLSANFESRINDIANFLKSNATLKLQITGHADATGPRDYNLWLSERRANTIRSKLIEHGIDSLRVEVLGKGFEHPIASNITESGRAQNRRVEFHLKDRSNRVVSSSRKPVENQISSF